MKLKNISKRYKEKIVFDSMNLEITKPGVYGIIGLSGSGKTTLLNMLYGIDTDFDGEYTIDNKKLKELKILNEYNDNISLVFQDTKLLENLSGYDNLKLANKTNSDIEELLNRFGILDLRDVEVKYYSGGEKQRLAIARALINEPKIILLDEPTAALDDRNTKFVLDTIKNLGSDKIIVVISHDERIIDYIDNLYELKEQNITLIKSLENTNENVVLKETTKNKNKIYKIAHKNFKANKKSFIPTAMALIVATIIFMLMSFIIVPQAVTVLDAFGTNGETTYYYYSSNCYQYQYQGAEAEQIEGICDIDQATIDKFENNESVVKVEPSDNITEQIDSYSKIETTVNQEILDFLGYDEDSSEAMTTIDQPLDIYVNLSSNDGYNGISLNESNIIGTLPDEPGEIAISNAMAMILFDTTNYNDVVGQTLTIDFSVYKYLTEEEQNAIYLEADINGVEPVQPTIDKTYTFTITAVYEYRLKGYEADNLEASMEFISENPDGAYGINDTIITYVTPYYELSDQEKQEFIDLYNYAYGTNLTTDNFTTGYTSIRVYTPYEESLVESNKNEVAKVLNTDPSEIYTATYTYEKLFLAVGLFLIGFLIIAVFIAIAIMCLNLMNLKMRKDEFAKYYLIGFNNRQVLTSVALEMVYLNLIVVPIGIIISVILFKLIFESMLLSSLALVVLITLLIIIFINLLIILWYFYANRRKKILKNLREAK